MTGSDSKASADHLKDRGCKLVELDFTSISSIDNAARYIKQVIANKLDVIVFIVRFLDRLPTWLMMNLSSR